MPTSVPYAIPLVISVARQIKPESVLDIGVGFGKYGFLLREYLDVWDIESVRQYGRAHWRTRIEGVEATPGYLTPLHEYVYDRIHVGDIVTLIDELGDYDMIVMADVIEHLPKDIGVGLLNRLFERARRCVVLTFPHACEPNDDVIGNPYESHRSRWDRSDFRRYPRCLYKVMEDQCVCVVLTKPSVTQPIPTRRFGVRRRSGWKGLVAKTMVRTMGTSAASRLASFVLRRRVALRG